MNTYKGVRDLDDLINLAKKNGWTVDMDAFDKTGSDFIYLKDLKVRIRQVAVNVTNGYFFVYEPRQEKPIASHLSQEFDDEEWYIEILDLVYEPLEAV